MFVVQVHCMSYYDLVTLMSYLCVMHIKFQTRISPDVSIAALLH